MEERTLKRLYELYKQGKLKMDITIDDVSLFYDFHLQRKEFELAIEKILKEKLGEEE